MDVQKAVYEAIEARGYVDGWAPGQFVVRQIAKLVEEVAEAAVYVLHPARKPWWLMATELAGQMARADFDQPEVWGGAHVWNVEKMKAELEDAQVVLLCAAEALARGSGEPFDVIAGALGKAEADVERGKR